jgi:hypothetical protein
MKKTLLYLAIGITFFATACQKEETPGPTGDYSIKPDSLLSGAGYANDVYYSLQNGVVDTRPKNEWDLAFTTLSQTASILINSGNKDSLFVWQGGTAADFNSASTANISQNLATNFSDSSWYNNSAFEQNLNPANSSDAGWGIYNSNTHDVVGDSVYILKLTDGSYKKIVIVSRSGVAGSTHDFTVKIADLAANAVAETVVIPTTTYSTKNFVYYSVVNKQIVDREPDKTTWDFVFTKYDSRQPGYPLVTGILTNEGVASAKLAVADSAISYKLVTFSKSIGNIGSAWKHFSNATSTYEISNPFYYVKSKSGQYFRIKFKAFDYTVGKTVFEKTLLK